MCCDVCGTSWSLLLVLQPPLAAVSAVFFVSCVVSPSDISISKRFVGLFTALLLSTFEKLLVSLFSNGQGWHYSVMWQDFRLIILLVRFNSGLSESRTQNSFVVLSSGIVISTYLSWVLWPKDWLLLERSLCRWEQLIQFYKQHFLKDSPVDKEWLCFDLFLFFVLNEQQRPRFESHNYTFFHHNTKTT